MALRVAALVACLLLSCCSGKGGGPQCPEPKRAELPPDRILDWSVSQGLWGSASLKLERDGKLAYHFQSVKPGEPAESGEVRLSPDEVSKVVATLRRSGVCGMCRARAGIPDEAAPILQIKADDLDCRVDAWDGEWRERAPAVFELMSELTARTRKPGP